MRILNDDHYIENEDHAMRDLGYCKSSKLNDKYDTHEATYYFSITFGYRNNNSLKGRDVNTVHNKIVRSSIGFDTDLMNDIGIQSRGEFNREKQAMSWY